MHLYFSGIGGTGIGPLALIAKKAGFEVSGSDKQNSGYIEYLKKHGITGIQIGQNGSELETLHVNNHVDWVVYSSSVVKENPNHPELVMAKKLGIKISKRDEFINYLLEKTGQKMIAIAGTHGKTTTTAMTIWAFKQLGIPVSYSVGAKLSFGDMGEFDEKAKYFVYEADEYDRNFLSFHPEVSIISGIDYDHPDVYPTRENYYDAFKQFISQSKQVHIWEWDVRKFEAPKSNLKIEATLTNLDNFTLLGKVNRQNAQLVVKAICSIGLCRFSEADEILNNFPGVSRRFEKISDNIYSDYAHTPEKIRGALQIAHEVAGNNVVVVYEGLHNTRQHFILDELKNLFSGVKKLFIVPSYLAREDESLELLTPEKLCKILDKPIVREPAKLDETLKANILELASKGTLVLCLSAGGGGSLDEWLRTIFEK